MTFTGAGETQEAVGLSDREPLPGNESVAYMIRVPELLSRALL